MWFDGPGVPGFWKIVVGTKWGSQVLIDSPMGTKASAIAVVNRSPASIHMAIVSLSFILSVERLIDPCSHFSGKGDGNARFPGLRIPETGPVGQGERGGGAQDKFVYGLQDG